MSALRSVLFTLFQAIVTPLYAAAVLSLFWLPRQARFRFITGWCRIMLWGARWICGIRYRVIGADNIRIYADVKKKHSSHAITADIDVGETTKAAELFGADGVIITGIATGKAITINDLGAARVATTLPLIVGSGVTPESVKDLFAYADALIVGSWYKREGLWSNPPDTKRAKELVKAVFVARAAH